MRKDVWWLLVDVFPNRPLEICIGPFQLLRFQRSGIASCERSILVYLLLEASFLIRVNPRQVCFEILPLRSKLRCVLDDADKGEISITPGDIEAVADDKLVWNHKTAIIDL